MRNLLTTQPPSDKNLDLFLTLMVFIMRIFVGFAKETFSGISFKIHQWCLI